MSDFEIVKLYVNKLVKALDERDENDKEIATYLKGMKSSAESIANFIAVVSRNSEYRR